MKCAACNGGIPPGKVLFCPTCFFSLPRREQGALVSHYVRVAKAEGKPVGANHPGLKDKIAKLVRIIREVRKLDAPAPTPETHPLAGYDLASADSVKIVRMPYGVLKDGNPRTEVQARFGDGVCPSMHRKLEQHLKEIDE